MKRLTLFLLLIFFTGLQAQKLPSDRFTYLDLFELSYVSDPQISPDGMTVVYRKMNYDIIKDKSFGNLWVYDVKTKEHYKLTSREVSEYGAKWTPNGEQLIFVSTTDQGAELYRYWWKHRVEARISQLEKTPSNISVSTDGQWLAFTMKVEKPAPSFGKMPPKPKGAQWAAAPRVTDRLKHEADGRGYISPGFNQVFVMPVAGGSVEQITDLNHSFSDLTWTKDGEGIIAVSNIKEEAEYDFNNSELYYIALKDKKIHPLTSRQGPDRHPVVSPDGKKIAYLSYEDKTQAYQVTKLNVMNLDGSDSFELSYKLDRSIKTMVWNGNANLLALYDDHGDTKLAKFDLKGNYKELIHSIGGTTLGRPYASGSFSLSSKGDIAYTHVSWDRPSRLALYSSKTKSIALCSDFNHALFTRKNLGKVEEINYQSKVDGRTIQGWIVYPYNYDPSKKYPLLVENHGGPILNYGARFSIEMQLYASAGYMVFYPNARGSNSYGEEFGNTLYRNYPGEDYNDVIDGVDTLIERGLAHEDQLFVTGGSAGGLMTAWMVGKSNRFEAAVVVKPVINWISKTLVADNYYGYANSRYEGQPWENPMHYWKFSPISIVDQVETPTMVMVGMNDLRTPPSEAKQFYHALKLRKVETVLVEIPGASHGIAARPSNLIRKIVTTLAWFEPYLIQ